LDSHLWKVISQDDPELPKSGRVRSH